MASGIWVSGGKAPPTVILHNICWGNTAAMRTVESTITKSGKVNISMYAAGYCYTTGKTFNYTLQKNGTTLHTAAKTGNGVLLDEVLSGVTVATGDTVTVTISSATSSNGISIMQSTVLEYV